MNVSPPCSPREDCQNKKGAGTVSALSYYQALALPMVRIKQQRPTPIGYSILPFTGDVYIKRCGCYCYHLRTTFKLRDLIIEDNINNTFTLISFLPQRLQRHGHAEPAANVQKVFTPRPKRMKKSFPFLSWRGMTAAGCCRHEFLVITKTA